jgi:hypothetical protein
MGRLEQHRLTAQAEAKLIGQIFASALFSALSKRPNALEPEDEGRSLHDPVVGAGPETCSQISADRFVAPANCG